MPFEPFLSCCLEMWDPARSCGVTPCCIMRKWNATWHMGSGCCLPGVGAAWHVLQPLCLEMSARLSLQKKLVAYLILYEEITDIALKGRKEDRVTAVIYTQDTSSGSTYLLSTFSQFVRAESCFYFSVFWHLCVPCYWHLSCGVHLMRGAFQLSLWLALWCDCTNQIPLRWVRVTVSVYFVQACYWWAFHLWPPDYS